MPCNSDYLDPTRIEVELRRTAKLLVYVHSRIPFIMGSWVNDEANNQYASDERLVPLLCDVLKHLTPEQTEHVVYDAHSAEARDLANWWEEHQAADREREAREQAEARHAELKRSALAKLTAEEAAVLAHDPLGIRHYP